MGLKEGFGQVCQRGISRKVGGLSERSVRNVFKGVWDRCVLLSFEAFEKGDLTEESWIRGKFDVKKIKRRGKK